MNNMFNDPIVDETRKAGEELAKKANYNIHTFFENLRQKEKKEDRKIISKPIEQPLTTVK